MGVIVKEAVANGRLTTRGGSERLASVARRLATTEDAVALAAAFHHPWADVVLSGAATAEQFDSNVRALEVDLDAETLRELEVLAEPPDDYWRRRSDLPWN